MECTALSAFEQVALQKENARLKDALYHQYAASALTGLLSNPSNSGRWDYPTTAKRALQLADAMLDELTHPKVKTK